MERRRYARVTVEIDIEMLVQINKKGSGKIINISEGGVFVETGVPVEVGNLIVIKFPGQKIMLGATVRRVTDKGFGAEFSHLTDIHKDVISKYHPNLGQVHVSSAAASPTILLVCDPQTQSSLANELSTAGFAVLETRNLDNIIPLTSRFEVVGIVSEYIVNGSPTLSILERVKAAKNPAVMIYSGRYDVPCDKFAEHGIDCLFKYNTCAQTAVSHLKKLIG